MYMYQLGLLVKCQFESYKIRVQKSYMYGIMVFIWWRISWTNGCRQSIALTSSEATGNFAEKFKCTCCSCNSVTVAVFNHCMIIISHERGLTSKDPDVGYILLEYLLCLLQLSLILSTMFKCTHLPDKSIFIFNTRNITFFTI